MTKKIITLLLFFSLNKQRLLSQVKRGIASFYADKFIGRRTATGEIFRQYKYTAASNHYKLGTIVRVTNPFNNRSVIVKINDRMHPRMERLGRVIDLSKAAIKELTEYRHLLDVKIEVL